MKKEEILKELKKITSNKDLRFPEALDIESNDGVLSLTMTTNGLKENMQENPAAFEGWAIAIKAIAPDLAKEVHIKWHGMGLKQGTEYNHYRRFLYRVIRFKESYDWAHYMPLDTEAENDKNIISSELSDWVVNYPDSESQKEASKAEATLERQLKNYLSKHLKHVDHQLPMGLFHSCKKSANERAPRQGSQIDLWSILDDTFTVYELKNDDNRKVGIISELMFYVNVIKDLSEGRLHFDSQAYKSTYRNFKAVYEAISSKSIRTVEGVFLTNDLHSMLKLGGSNLFSLLNNNTRNINYKQMGFKISEIFDIAK